MSTTDSTGTDSTIAESTPAARAARPSRLRSAARRARRVLALGVTTAVVATGCGLSSGGAVPLSVGPGSITENPALKGVPITVGGKDFTEQAVLAYLLEFMLDAAGMKVNDLSSLAGSNSFREALKNGQVDVGIDYTGTAWISYLGQEQPIPDPHAQWQAVHDADLANGVVWLPPTKVDNTYALAMNRSNAAATGVKTLSDYAELVKKDPKQASACLETEFNVRRDGFPGMAAKYGFDAASVPISILQTGIIYQATAVGAQCHFGEVFTTDGRIKGLDLQLVTDDKHFFPVYNAAVEIRKATLDAHPEIAKVVAPLETLLTNQVMLDLNAEVDVDGRDPAVVARDFLVKKGLVTAG